MYLTDDGIDNLEYEEMMGEKTFVTVEVLDMQPHEVSRVGLVVEWGAEDLGLITTARADGVRDDVASYAMTFEQVLSPTDVERLIRRWETRGLKIGAVEIAA